MSRNAQIAILTVLLLACCCVLVGLAAVFAWIYPATTRTGQVALPTVADERALPTPPTASLPVTLPAPSHSALPTPTWAAPLATPVATPPHVSPSMQQADTEARLRAAELPTRDIRLLAERLRKIGPIPMVVHQDPPAYQVGDRHVFWVGNVDTLAQFPVPALLRYETPHLYMWVEEGADYDHAGLARSAERFESQIYPTTRAFFGSEWSPGVDGDPHLHVLHASARYIGGTVAGYYSSADQYATLANPYSNEREMFYISLNGVDLGSAYYDGVLAHEFQHMIHWANDRNEDSWVNEGCSELAVRINGIANGGFDALFLSDPDVQLTAWPEGYSAGAHYGASYLFMDYVLSRFGEQTTQRVVAHPANGAAGFDAVFAEQGLGFDVVFADWLVANYLDGLALDPARVDARYSYPDRVVGPVPAVLRGAVPASYAESVHQYGADYVRFEGEGDLSVSFSGASEVRLVPVDARSGRYAWWSNRGDDSDMRLTRTLDLRGLERATLVAWMWYDIERDWDYAYVVVSADGGQTWDVLAGPSSTSANPNGNSLGPAYTGESGGWVEESFDLSPYAGQEVVLCFEYVTDDAVNRAGWLIDDVRVPELGYADDMESGTGGWHAEGFVYSDNRVRQRWALRLIALGKRTEVYPVAVNASGQGQVTLRGLGSETEAAVLVISALAPATTEIAPYTYTVQPLE
ncbi:MAG: immune inhibitor A [Anaerolineae bacterium]|nr:immune inhibitor A [Anaerolineae bacterium]